VLQGSGAVTVPISHSLGLLWLQVDRHWYGNVVLETELEYRPAAPTVL
jgi:hypothetical protein